MYKDNMVAANENVTEAQVQTRTEIPAIPKREEVYEGFNEVTFNNMTTSDREQFVYSDDVYDINVNVNSKQTFTGEISINQTKIDISEEYEKCNSMLNIDLAFADINRDDRQDVIMKMTGDKMMTFAIFLADGEGYVKLSEPDDKLTVKINVLTQGMVDGKFVVYVEKLINYMSIPSGVGYTQVYKITDNDLKLADTQIYNTDARYR